MIQFLPCPSCKRTLVIAQDVSLKAELRCRNCAHQFVLGEMIETELGYWEVLADPGPVEANSETTSNVLQPITLTENETPNENSEVSELALAETEFEAPTAFTRKRPATTQVEWSKFEPFTREQNERMRRKTRSPIWSMLSVLLGGLSSIPIATLLIWHVLGKDPLQMGPVVGRYVPWIVPTRFQPFEPDVNTNPSEPLGSGGFRRFDEVMNPSNSKVQTTADDVASASDVTNGLTNTRNLRDRQAFDATNARSSQSGDSQRSELETDTIVKTPATETMIDNEPADQENVFKFINKLESDLADWNSRTSDKDTQKKLAQQTYANLSALASAMEDLPEGSPLRRMARSEMQKAGQLIAQRSDVQDLVNAGSRFWLLSHKLERRIGLAITIEVGAAKELENGWQVQTTASSSIGTPPLTIIAAKDIAPSLAPGKRLFILGCVKPAELDSTILEAANTLRASYILDMER